MKEYDKCDLEKFLNKLSPKIKQVIKMKIEGYSPKDIGIKLGQKTATINRALERGKVMIREKFKMK